MQLDAGWVSALASIASTVIVAVTAIAAFAQLRHYRNANDMVVYLRLIDQMDSERFTQARFLWKEFKDRVVRDEELRSQLTNPDFLSEKYRPIGESLRYLEHISVLVTNGNIAEKLILAEYADTFVEIWETARDMIQLRRMAFGPHTGRAFEHLAMRSKIYIDSGKMDRFYRNLLADTRPLTRAEHPTQ